MKQNRIVDAAMTILMPFLMAYSLIGETFHEVAGTLLFLLFLAHHFQHRNWIKAIPKGKYTAYRVFTAALNTVLFFLMILQPASGIVMSKHLFSFLPFSGGMSTARTIHLCLAYWCCVLMSVHLGLHVAPMLRATRVEKEPVSKGVLLACRAGISAVSVYGAYVFVRRQFPVYLFLRSQFVLFDFSELWLSYVVDCIAIMVLFATLGHLIGKGFKR